MKLAYLCTAWLLGIGIAWRWSIPLPIVLAAASAIGAFLLFSAWRKGLRLWILWLPLLFFVGFSRFYLWAPQGNVVLPNFASSSQPVQIQGRIVSYPEERGNTFTFHFQAEEVRSGTRTERIAEKVLVNASPPSGLINGRERPYFRYGDRLSLGGKLNELSSFSGFDYPSYLANQGIRAIFYYPKVKLLEEGEGSKPLEVLFWIRFQLIEALKRAVSEPQGSVSEALLLGLRRDIPQWLTNAFARSGTAHILAISGLHVAVIMGIAMRGVETLWGRRYLLHLTFPLLIIWVYTLVAGAPPSAVRAALMGSLYLLALMLGRRGSGANALLLAAAFMVGLDPANLGNISFQLSFAAMTGLIFLTPTIMSPGNHGIAVLEERHPRLAAAIGFLWGSVAVSLGATIATLPLIAFYFHRVSLTGIPATLLILPALPFVLASGLISSIGGFIHPVLGNIAGWASWITTSYMLLVVNLFSNLPFASLDMGKLGETLLWVYYAFVIAVFGLTQIHQKMTFITKLKGLLSDHESAGTIYQYRWHLALLGISAAVVWLLAFTLPSDKLRVTFFDVGQGDSVLIDTPSGRQVLIDGGADPQVLLQRLGEAMPFWDKTIDLVVMTHPHKDHIGGLVGVLKRYEVGKAMENGFPDNSNAYVEWRKEISSKGIPVVIARRGQVIELGDGLNLEVLNPPEPLIKGTSNDTDNNGVVLRLRDSAVSFLITGDFEWEGEDLLIGDGVELQSTVLKVGHHGSKTSTSASFLQAINPALAVISVGADNPYGHPSPETMERLQAAVRVENIYITRDRGTIQFVTNGERLWVRTTK